MCCHTIQLYYANSSQSLEGAEGTISSHGQPHAHNKSSREGFFINNSRNISICTSQAENRKSPKPPLPGIQRNINRQLNPPHQAGQMQAGMGESLSCPRLFLIVMTENRKVLFLSCMFCEPFFP